MNIEQTPQECFNGYYDAAAGAARTVITSQISGPASSIVGAGISIAKSRNVHKLFGNNPLSDDIRAGGRIITYTLFDTAVGFLPDPIPGPISPGTLVSAGRNFIANSADRGLQTSEVAQLG
ncbi:hypothetical protein CS022_02090 [Veronia nyctiphanis]|uniref:Uncharacterized protein n=1 Tax=Veronia nyctiphanis TaxID=1278244 RepID=A0A4Q0YT84_9GAMM|nr:hypothetical protein CS022_02090 [Veronia nyctiphanis]